MNSRPQASRLLTWMLLGVWAGIVAGLIEGLGLMAFQRINWARWGPMMHVSSPILWISPIVDVCFFVLIALCSWLITRMVRGNPPIRILAALLVYLAVYDWLTLTGRLHRLACI